MATATQDAGQGAATRGAAGPGAGRWSVRRDRLLLETVALLYRRAPFLPGRLLDWLGFDLWGCRMFSPRWARLGVLAVRSREFRAWLLVNPGYWQQRYLYLTGRGCEREIAAYLRRELRPGDVFVDVGANFGMHTLHAADLVGPEGRCLAFEPNPEAYGLLVAHLRGNRIANVTARRLALGDTAVEAATLTVPDLPGGAPDAESSVASLRTGQDDGGGRRVEVRQETGDRALADLGPATSGVCKIDVEGFELEVLRGMAGFLASHPRMSYCVEVTPGWLTESQGGAGELFRIFADAGLAPFLPAREGLTALDEPPAAERSDVVFTRPETARERHRLR